MTFTWPNFDEPKPIHGNISWTAIFESYDQRNEVAYYLMTLLEDGREPRHIMAQTDIGWAGDDWSSPEFALRIRSELDQVARRGDSNTRYLGSLAR